MYAHYILPIAVFISMFVWTMCLCNVENFLFLDKTSDKLIVNPNLLQHTILLADDQNKIDTESHIIDILCSKNESMLKNMIKYGDVSRWSAWISPESKEGNTHIDDINRQFFYYVKNKIEKSKHLKLIFHKLQKYRYDIKGYDNLLLDYDIVCHDVTAKCAWYIKILCVIDIDKKRVHFMNIKLVGSISEDNIYISGGAVSGADANVEGGSSNSEIERLFDKDIMYQDNCLSIKTQDAQCLHIMYNRLMTVADELDMQNIQYTKNQQLVKNMFFNKLRGGFKEPNVKIKCYPYENDFVLRYKS